MIVTLLELRRRARRWRIDLERPRSESIVVLLSSGIGLLQRNE